MNITCFSFDGMQFNLLFFGSSAKAIKTCSHSLQVSVAAFTLNSLRTMHINIKRAEFLTDTTKYMWSGRVMLNAWCSSLHALSLLQLFRKRRGTTAGQADISFSRIFILQQMTVPGLLKSTQLKTVLVASTLKLTPLVVEWTSIRKAASFNIFRK